MTLDLDSHRLAARRLLAELASDDPVASAVAAGRLRRLRTLAGLDDAELGGKVGMAHALAVVAEEAGYASWRELAAEAEAAARPPAELAAALRADPGDFWYPRAFDIFLNRWFARHEEGRRALEADGGFLLPYRHQVFLCTPEAIRWLGMDPDDPGWAAIGHDAARPADDKAFARLVARRQAARGEGRR